MQWWWKFCYYNNFWQNKQTNKLMHNTGKQGAPRREQPRQNVFFLFFGGVHLGTHSHNNRERPSPEVISTRLLTNFAAIQRFPLKRVTFCLTPFQRNPPELVAPLRARHEAASATFIDDAATLNLWQGFHFASAAVLETMRLLWLVFVLWQRAAAPFLPLATLIHPLINFWAKSQVWSNLHRFSFDPFLIDQ